MTSDASLYDLLSDDRRAMHSVTSALYKKILADELLAPYFASVDIDRQASMLAEFLAMAFGGSIGTLTQNLDTLQAMRILAAVRLSDETDETTSPERQLAKINAYASTYCHSVIGPAIDLDVSGAVSPFKRPQLGPWLERPDQWDGLAVAKFDRISRSVRDFSELCEWLTERGKALICLDPAIDLTTAGGVAYAQMLAVFAQFERAMIAERVKDAYYHLRRSGQYPGGAVPFGLRAERTEPKGWQLVPDPDYAPFVKEMVARYLAGKSMRSIALWLNDQNIPASRDAQRIRTGKKRAGKGWTQASVRTVLMSPALAGHVATERDPNTDTWKPLRDLDGLAVTVTPLISQADYGRLLAARTARRPAPRSNASRLLGVAFCADCDSPLNANRADDYAYYKCSRRTAAADSCTAKSVRQAWLDNVTVTAFLTMVADVEIAERVVIPGSDHAAELARVTEAIENLQDVYAAGDVYTGRAGTDRYATQMRKLEARHDALAALPSIPARTDYVPTGVTFGQRWAELDDDGHRQLMVTAGFRACAAMVARDKMWLRLVIDPDLARRAGLAAAGLSTERQFGEPVDISKVRLGANFYLQAGDDIAAMVRRALASWP